MAKLDEIQIQEASRALCEAMVSLGVDAEKEFLVEKATSFAEALVAGLEIIRESGSAQ